MRTLHITIQYNVQNTLYKISDETPLVIIT